MTPPGSRLDILLPTYDFNVRRSRMIHSEPHAVYDAFSTLTPREMPASRLLFAARSLPGRLVGTQGPPSRLDVPLLDQFLELGFVLLVDLPGQELVTGAIGRMWRRGGGSAAIADGEEFAAFAEPGFAKVAMAFRCTARDDGATLAEIETRVAATDPAARAAFGRYWMLIRGFSGIIRRDWLRAVARRATSGCSAGHARRRVGWPAARWRRRPR